MKLYRIKRANTPEYFYGWNWRGTKEIWGKSGGFYKNPDVIAHYLAVLCGAGIDYRLWSKRNVMEYPKMRFDRRRLKNYKVVIDEVECLQRRGMSASNFMKEIAA